MGNYSLDMTPLIQQTLGWAGLGLVLALLLLTRGLRRREIRIFGLLSAAAVMGTAFLTLYCNEATYRRTTARVGVGESVVRHGGLCLTWCLVSLPA